MLKKRYLFQLLKDRAAKPDVLRGMLFVFIEATMSGDSFGPGVREERHVTFFGEGWTENVDGMKL